MRDRPCYLVLPTSRLFSVAAPNLCTINQDSVVGGTAGDAVSVLGKTGPTLNYFFPQSNKGGILINKLENATYQDPSRVLRCELGGFY